MLKMHVGPGVGSPCISTYALQAQGVTCFRGRANDSPVPVATNRHIPKSWVVSGTRESLRVGLTRSIWVGIGCHGEGRLHFPLVEKICLNRMIYDSGLNIRAKTEVWRSGMRRTTGIQSRICNPRSYLREELLRINLLSSRA